MKKIATMQDISCVGKCSLTVALPVISAIGIETAVIPTAVLSTHTMFHDFTFHDLTSEIKPIMDHWKKEHFHFDAVYTGYLGSLDQVKLAMKLFDTFGQGIKLVDPCMADNGKLYAGFTEEFAAAMRKLCAKADIIVPNMTEACFLLDIPYQTEYDEKYVRIILRKLTNLGCAGAMITGVSLQKGKIGVYGYDRRHNSYISYFNNEEPVHFHGTGDLFAATFIGCMVSGKSAERSIEIACDFVKKSIHLTLAEDDHNTYGVNFEQAFPSLLRALNKEE